MESEEEDSAEAVWRDTDKALLEEDEDGFESDI
jgi:hypothetical protein